MTSSRRRSGSCGSRSTRSAKIEARRPSPRRRPERVLDQLGLGVVEDAHGGTDVDRSTLVPAGCTPTSIIETRRVCRRACTAR